MEWDEPTKALINDVAERAAEKTVRITLTGLGVDTDNPLEVQKDFQFMRSMRETWSSTKSRGMFVALGLMITGFFSFFWSAVKATISGGPID